MRSLKSHEGFTLIEAMIVVMIGGVIAYMAAVNYQKQTFIARQTEAKTLLAQVHSLEKVYYSQMNTYTACVVEIGMTPTQGGGYYAAGISGYTLPGPLLCGRGDQSCMATKFSPAGVADMTTTCADPTGTQVNAERYSLGGTASGSNVKYYLSGTGDWGDCPALSSPSLCLYRAIREVRDITAATFVAGAAGMTLAPVTSIFGVGTYFVDTWSIDQDKNLRNYLVP